MSQKWGWKTIHGPVLKEIYLNHPDVKSFDMTLDLIFSGKLPVVEDIIPFNQAAKDIDLIDGKMTGGNLKIVESSIGTEWQINTTGKILFLEETNETEYAIDRSLIHLSHANLLSNVKAIIFGSFEMRAQEVEFAIRKFAQSTKIPVFKTKNFGHDKKNYPIIYNHLAFIKRIKEQNYRLEFAKK